MTNKQTTIEERNFLDALQHCLKNGTFVVRVSNFEGWKDGCDCKDCLSQRVIFEFVFGDTRSEAKNILNHREVEYLNEIR